MTLVKDLIRLLIAVVVAIAFFVIIDYVKVERGQEIGTGSAVKEMKKNVEGPKLVTKIIDGDTIIVEGNTVRLLGIDADEKGYPCYDAAKAELERLILGREVYLEYFDEEKDSYGRHLRYVILDGENINVKMVREGFVLARVSEDYYKELILSAEQFARENGLGCKWQTGWQVQTSTMQNLTWKMLAGEAIYACQAKNYIGKEKIVEGKIVDTYKSKSNNVFLNFELPYPNQCFSAVIFNSSLENFPPNPEKYYRGKTVRVKGVIKDYKGRAEIILENSEQIEIAE